MLRFWANAMGDSPTQCGLTEPEISQAFTECACSVNGARPDYQERLRNLMAQDTANVLAHVADTALNG